ncbi:MAG: MarR family transcriptional regulator [Paenibacillaceae bacterium]|jgi:DNA-binding MarR family transcriptional regulator|nr:MarR family transcriptional regulator [Paenibacillaceae bacterium]
MCRSHDYSNSLREKGSAKEALTLELLGHLETAFRRYKQERSKIASRMNLAEGQIILLVMLGKRLRCNASDIAAHIGITSGAVTGMTDKLVQLGLVHRERSEEDRRVVHFSLTSDGGMLVEHIRAEQYRLMLEMVGSVTEEELGHVIRFFHQINNYGRLTEDEGREEHTK